MFMTSGMISEIAIPLQWCQLDLKHHITGFKSPAGVKSEGGDQNWDSVEHD